ncbi:hypothetical protein SS50377_28081 [Spironucleus salmonicida]|uniref:Uncharacterized protein n=1 Tax=Spironucleus salmonicida TaxID=348837 RepID=V6LDR8_9EUKA|nr:hypothetical protein SS50377_28081 [Spironucleus salmonicida]|eukprot:EST42632.1 Hypothetical protein SS50377_17951 [Spironucleus salmonicida]
MTLPTPFQNVAKSFITELLGSLNHQSKLYQFITVKQSKNQVNLQQLYSTKIQLLYDYKQYSHFLQPSPLPPISPLSLTSLSNFSYKKFAKLSKLLAESHLNSVFSFQKVDSQTSQKVQKKLKETCEMQRVVPIFELKNVSDGKVIKGGKEFVLCQCHICYVLYFLDQNGAITKGSKSEQNTVFEFEIREVDGGKQIVENGKLGVFGV